MEYFTRNCFVAKAPLLVFYKGTILRIPKKPAKDNILDNFFLIVNSQLHYKNIFTSTPADICSSVNGNNSVIRQTLKAFKSERGKRFLVIDLCYLKL